MSDNTGHDFREWRASKVLLPSQSHSLIGSLSMRVFETPTATGSELFSLLTCLYTTTFTLLSILSPLQMISIKTWETPLSLHAKMLSSGCRPRLKNARA